MILYTFNRIEIKTDFFFYNSLLCELSGGDGFEMEKGGVGRLLSQRNVFYTE